MAEFYQSFTVARTSDPDPGSLFAGLKALDATMGYRAVGASGYVLQKSTVWTAPDIAAAQAVLDSCVASSAQLAAQNEIDHWPIALKAFALALIDQLNVIRAALPTPLPPITPTQALAAIRAKAGTL